MADAKPNCVLVDDARRYPKTVIRSIRFDEPNLIVDLQGPSFSFVRLYFNDVVGYRVIDEREITEFWNDYSKPNGWLWEVIDGGWLSLERTRERFNSLAMDLREFFVVDNYCINVMCHDSPKIIDLGSNPQSS